MTEKPSIYSIPGLPQVPRPENPRKPLLKAIAEAWEIPEEKLLAHKELGSSLPKYTKPRYFYYYVLNLVLHFNWNEMKILTGRDIAAIQYGTKRAVYLMENQKQYMIKAESVLNAMKRDEIELPKVPFILNINVRES